ncbi:MAG: protein-glutamate O-methyltransferase CheR [Xanthobacteraceae bacterium]
MSVAATSYEAERFRELLSQRIGLSFDNAKLGFLGEVLRRRIDACGRDCTAYLCGLEHEPPAEELSMLARELTVGETYFFRNHEQFQALAEVVLPQRAALPPAQKTLRLLSAGCSSGEEAYSLAIVAREMGCGASCRFAIRAVDINPLALQKARRARYSAWALRETGEDIRDRWFRVEGREMVLDDSIRAMVTIEAGNIASDEAALWHPAAYDVIFCRNVLMYFAPQQMRRVVGRIARSLAPGGFLFLGHAETLRGISEEFQLCASHGSFYYRHNSGTASEGVAAIEFAAKQSLPRLPSAAPPQGTAWFDVIGRASARVATLLPACHADGRADQAPPASPPFDPTPTLELLREERFAEALDRLRVQVNGCGRDAQASLLETALLVLCGEIAAAEAAASRLLRLAPDDAGGHYLLALCREHAGDGNSAAEHHWEAAVIDPSFAMPRLQLGLLARRGGDRETASRELSQARVLLKREAASRLLLFGGGFSRETLVALCEAALADCRGRR